MPKLSSLKPSGTQRVLVYGPPKTGKTQLAGECAAEFPLLYFGLENGHDTMFKLPAEWHDRIEIINLPDTRTWPIAAETMLKVIKGGEHKICEEHGKINCMACMKMGAPISVVNLDRLPDGTIVIVDSLTQLTNSIIAHITKDRPDDYKLDYDDWGNLGKLMDMFLSHVQQARYNVICISHETESELEDGKHRIVPVAGTRNFSRNTAKYFDHVVYAEVKNGKHQFGSSTLYANNIVTGSRTGATLERHTNPSLLEIMKGHIPTPQSSSSATSQVASLNSLASRLGKK